MTNTDNVAPQLAAFMTGGQRPADVEAFVKRIHETKDTQMVNSWRCKMSRKERYLCEAGVGDALEYFGYETEFDGNATLSPFKATYYTSHDLGKRIKNRLTRKFK